MLIISLSFSLPAIMVHPLSTCSLRIISWVLICVTTGTNGLIAYDCGHEKVNITAVSAISVGACQLEAAKIVQEQEDVQLLQLSEITTMHVFQCKINVIQTVYKCGMFSHLSLVHGGLSTFIVDISRDDCMNIHHHRTYSLSNGRVVADLQLNGTTMHTETIAGTVNNDGSCKGAPYTSGANSWDDVIVTHALEFTITDYTGSLRLEDDQVILRNNIVCPYLPGKCTDPEYGMSFWEMVPDTSCENLKYDVLWQGTAVKVRSTGNSSTPIGNTIYTVHSDEVIFALEVKRPISVCRFPGFQTEHPRLMIVPRTAANYWFTKKPVDPKNLDLFTYVNSKFVYTERHFKTQVEKLYRNLLMKKCELKRDLLRTQLTMAPHHPAEFALMRMKEPGYMAVPRGEIIYLVKCQPVDVSIRKTNRCFTELPVQYDNRSYFMTPTTHLIQRHGNEIPCSSIMSPGYLVQGEWYGLNPNVHRLHAPVELTPSQQADWIYDDPGKLIKAGIYPFESLDELRHQIMYPSERLAIGNILTQSVAGHDVDRQNIDLMHLLSPTTFDELASAVYAKFWGIFSWIGSLSSGVFGIYVCCRAIKYLIEIMINVHLLRAVFGWSWRLFAAIWNSTTNTMLHRHHHHQSTHKPVTLHSVLVQDHPEVRKMPPEPSVEPHKPTTLGQLKARSLPQPPIENPI